MLLGTGGHGQSLKKRSLRWRASRHGPSNALLETRLLAAISFPLSQQNPRGKRGKAGAAEPARPEPPPPLPGWRRALLRVICVCACGGQQTPKKSLQTPTNPPAPQPQDLPAPQAAQDAARPQARAPARGRGGSSPPPAQVSLECSVGKALANDYPNCSSPHPWQPGSAVDSTGGPGTASSHPGLAWSTGRCWGHLLLALSSAWMGTGMLSSSACSAG